MAELWERFIDRLKASPVGPLVNWSEQYPRLSAWIVLSLGMVILLVIEARDVGLLAGQWVALIVATILVAGACIWIISWEDDEIDENSDAQSDMAESTDTASDDETDGDS